jgi:hypothetical protein
MYQANPQISDPSSWHYSSLQIQKTLLESLFSSFQKIITFLVNICFIASAKVFLTLQDSHFSQTNIDACVKSLLRQRG